MKKDVLFLSQHFYPEHISSATLPFDAARYLVEQGLTVGALCGYPKEFLMAHQSGIPKGETVDGVSIKRLRYLHANRRSVVGRVLNFFSFSAGVFCHLRELKKAACVVVYSNPPVLPLAAVAAKKLFHTKIVFVSYDVYPETAYAAGTFGAGHPIARAMRTVNRSLFKCCDAVVALSEDMKTFLHKNRAIPADRITVIPNWASEEDEMPEGTPHKAAEPFTVAYLGNMGVVQDMKTMTDACRQLQDSDVCFSFTGRGCKLEEVRCAISDCRNAEISNFLIGDEFIQKIAQASVCVVSLEPGLTGLCAPSKYYSYLCAGKPVIFIGDSQSCLAQDVIENRIGYVVENGDSQALCDLLLQMKQNPQETALMAQRAKALYDGQYAKRHALQRYFAVVDAMLDRGTP